MDWHKGLDVDAAIAGVREALTEGDGQRLRACLERARDHEVAGVLKTAKSVQTEVPFVTVIARQLITGVMDVLAEMEDGSALIGNWKTGAHFEEHESDYELQRGLYSFAALGEVDTPSSIGTLWVALEGASPSETNYIAPSALPSLEAAFADQIDAATGIGLLSGRGRPRPTLRRLSWEPRGMPCALGSSLARSIASQALGFLPHLLVLRVRIAGQ